MKHTELPLVDYIELLDEKATAYIHTKDKRVVVLEDVRSSMSLDDDGVYVDHMFLGKRMTFAMPREDFSHVEYYYVARPNSQQVEDNIICNPVPDLLSEPYIDITEDLI